VSTFHCDLIKNTLQVFKIVILSNRPTAAPAHLALARQPGGPVRPCYRRVLLLQWAVIILPKSSVNGASQSNYESFFNLVCIYVCLSVLPYLCVLLWYVRLNWTELNLGLICDVVVAERDNDVVGHHSARLRDGLWAICLQTPHICRNYHRGLLGCRNVCIRSAGVSNTSLGLPTAGHQSFWHSYHTALLVCCLTTNLFLCVLFLCTILFMFILFYIMFYIFSVCLWYWFYIMRQLITE